MCLSLTVGNYAFYHLSTFYSASAYTTYNIFIYSAYTTHTYLLYIPHIFSFFSSSYLIYSIPFLHSTFYCGSENVYFRDDNGSASLKISDSFIFNILLLFISMSRQDIGEENYDKKTESHDEII